MTERYNYPIKYAVLELKEKGGWLVNYQDYVVGYVVSKCYVLEKITKYLENGKEKTQYKVVFPYKDISSYEVGLRNNESKLRNRNKPVANNFITDIVDRLYDTYEEAKTEEKQKNKNLEDDISMCMQYEKAIQKSTTDMEVTIDKPKIYELKN